MKFSVDQISFVKKLECLPNILNDIRPIFNTILIEADDRVYCTARVGLENDHYFIVKVVIDADIKEKGKACVIGAEFLKILKEMPEGETTISLLTSQLKAENSGTRVKLKTYPIDEYPIFPEEDLKFAFKDNCKEFKTKLDFVSVAQGVTVEFSTEGTNFEINDGKFNIVATDGKRLALYKDIESKEDNFIVPYKMIGQLKKSLCFLDGNVNVSYNEKFVLFETEDKSFKILGSILNAKYPAYHKFIPNESIKKLIVDKKKMVVALKRASLLRQTDKHEDPLILTLKNNVLTLSKDKEYVGDIVENVDVDFNGEITLGFNPQYLLDAMLFDENNMLAIEINEPNTPIVIRCGKYIYLALPMSLE